MDKYISIPPTPSSPNRFTLTPEDKANLPSARRTKVRETLVELAVLTSLGTSPPQDGLEQSGRAPAASWRAIRR